MATKTKKPTVSKETLFPRSWTHDDFIGVSQPYVMGLYIALTEQGRTVGQAALSYKDLSRFVKELQSTEGVANLNLAKLGDYLSDSEIELINS